MLAEHRLDLPRFDAITADLDLIVEPAQKLDVSIRQVTSEIAGLVQTLGRFCAKEMIYKFSAVSSVGLVTAR